ncbi:hypothetical protein F8388_006404, partial [Cannabis sativa]
MLSVFLQISLPPNLFNLQTEIQEAMDLFTKMKLDNLQVQPEIYGELLQGCVYALDLSTGQQIHDRIGSSETVSFWLGNTFDFFYSKFDAYSVASRMFQMVSSKNVFSWAAIIGMNCRMGFCEEALLGLLELLDSGHFPDNFVVPNALKACGAFQWIGMGKGIHGYAIKMGYGNGICVFVSSSLGDMYGKCGAMEDARMVFDGIPEKNVVTWNSLMVGYVLNGENEKTINYLSASANIAAPDEGKQGHAMAIVEAFNLGSSKVSLIEDAGLVFSKMAEKYAVNWNLIISGYVKNNLKLGKEGLINCMPFEPNAHIFRSQLAACREHNKTELTKSIRVGPDNSGNYVALSNAYAAVGQWDKLKNVRHLMKTKGLMNVPGCKSHVFVAGDQSHFKIVEINLTLALFGSEVLC